MNVIYLFNENKRTSINYIKFKSYCVYNIIEMTNMFFFYKQYYYELREEEYNNTNIYVSNKKWKHQNSYIPFKKRHISEDYETLMKRLKFFRSVSIHDLKNNKNLFMPGDNSSIYDNTDDGINNKMHNHYIFNNNKNNISEYVYDKDTHTHTHTNISSEYYKKKKIRYT